MPLCKKNRRGTLRMNWKAAIVTGAKQNLCPPCVLLCPLCVLLARIMKTGEWLSLEL